MFAYTRFRQPVGAVFFTLVVSLSLTSCRAYRHSAIRPDAMVDMVQVFVLDENFPEQVAWQVDVSALRESGLEGKLTRLTSQGAKAVSKGHPQKIAKGQRLQMVVFYLKSDYAQTLLDSTEIHLSFDQVTRSVVYQFHPGESMTRTAVLTASLSPLSLILIIAVACSCPAIYVENPGEVVFKGDIYAGSTHPQLERHDWLPLPGFQPGDNEYRLRMVNEESEIQHINLVELVVADHAPGVMVLFDKYGRLQTVSQPETPVSATDLAGRDVRSAIVQSDSLVYSGNPDNDNERAEDGLILSFRRPQSARQARLVIRGNSSPWLAYSHELLQRNLGVYGPHIRQKFLKKDSADLQQWALRQNIPLSVWIETTAGKWEKADFFSLIGPKAPRYDALSLDLSKVQGDQVRIKLSTGFRFWEIDYVALDFSDHAAVQIQTLPLLSATDRQGLDLADDLRNDDGRYYQQTQLHEEARLRFTAPPLAAGASRTILLHAKGYYQIVRPAAEGKPGLRFLRRFKRNDAFPQYSRDQWRALHRQQEPTPIN